MPEWVKLVSPAAAVIITVDVSAVKTPPVEVQSPLTVKVWVSASISALDWIVRSRQVRLLPGA